MCFAPAPHGGIRVSVDPGGTPVWAASRIDASAVFTRDELTRGVPLTLAERLVLLLHMADSTVGDATNVPGVLGSSVGIRRVRLAIERLADLADPVLIRGEAGTGKEFIARAIHERSPHRAGPFISVNLGAIAPELVAAELFGWTVSGMTQRVERDGLFWKARGGTLFLDGVGAELPGLRPGLLRWLETGKIQPIGATRPIAVQVRLIAATHARLSSTLRSWSGRFKARFLRPFEGHEVWLPPLSDRREDIGALFYHFAGEELAAIGESYRLSPQDPAAEPWLPADVAAQLVRYPWPGNVRELRNVTRQLVNASRGLSQLRLDPSLAPGSG